MICPHCGSQHIETDGRHWDCLDCGVDWVNWTESYEFWHKSTIEEYQNHKLANSVFGLTKQR